MLNRKPPDRKINMRRYWIDEVPTTNDVHFTDDVFHHIVHVCRQDVGSKFEVLPGDGKAYFVEIIDVRKKDAYAKVLEVREIPPLPKPEITLAISLPKFSTFDTILEKAAEMGVARIVPFTSEFSFVRDTKLLSQKMERWQKIVRGACQQSGRGQLMELNQPQALEQVLFDFEARRKINRNGGITGLFPYEGQASRNVREALTGVDRDAREFWVFVGSEGGFSTKEVELFQQFSLIATTLGSQVLRVETACLALVAIIRYELGQFS